VRLGQTGVNRMQLQPCVQPLGLIWIVFTSDLKLRVVLADHELVQRAIVADEVAQPTSA
jgi:hypothetical protein